MVLEQAQTDKFNDIEKQLKKYVESTTTFLATRSQRIRDPTTTLGSAKSTLLEIKSKIEQLESMIANERLVESLKQFLEDCSLEDLHSTASTRLEEVERMRQSWQELLSDMVICVSSKEEDIAQQKRDTESRKQRMVEVGKQVDKLREAGLKHLEDARALNTNQFGRNPIASVKNKIEEVQVFRERITKLVEKVNETSDVSTPAARKALSQLNGYIRECDSILDSFSKKRKHFESNVQSMILDGTSHSTETNITQTVMSRQNKNSRVPKPNSKYF